MTTPVGAEPHRGAIDIEQLATGRVPGPSKVFGVSALLLAIAYFAWRGVWRGVQNSGDLAVGYSAGRAWLLGHDPYDAAVLASDLSQAGGADIARSGLLDWLQNVYFPTTLPAFAPLAVASWPAARLIFLALNIGAVLFVGIGLVRLLGWRPASTRALALMAFLLALAPVHTTIASGQTAIVATAALVAAVLLEREGHWNWSGLLYGMATILKIQIGLPFVAYLAWRRRWVAGSIAGALVAGSTLLAVLRMHAAGVPWVSSWLTNLSALAGPGGMNDSSLQNPDRFSLINLQILLFNVIPDVDWVNVLTLGLVAAAALSLVCLIRGHDRQQLLALSVVAVLALLVAYHRYYDAVLLAFPVAWGLSALASTRRREAAAVLLLSADFVLPFQSALHELEQDQRLPAWLTGGPLWENVLLIQHVWALVLMTLVLLFAAARERAESAVS
jgi:glycosyl transferase family 87